MLIHLILFELKMNNQSNQQINGQNKIRASHNRNIKLHSKHQMKQFAKQKSIFPKINVYEIQKYQHPIKNNKKNATKDDTPKQQSQLYNQENKYSGFVLKTQQKQSQDVSQAQTNINPEEAKKAAKSLRKKNRKINTPSLKNLLVARDQVRNPFKYKIAQKHMGYQPNKVYLLKLSELFKIQQDYQKKKGIEYLRLSNSNQQVNHQEVAQKQTILRKSLDQQIRDTEETNHLTRSKNQKTAKSAKELKKQEVLQKFREQEDLLGQRVYQRVKRHLHQQKHNCDFFRRIHSEQKVDSAFIDFLKLKIMMAESTGTTQ